MSYALLKGKNKQALLCFKNHFKVGKCESDLPVVAI